MHLSESVKFQISNLESFFWILLTCGYFVDGQVLTRRTSGICYEHYIAPRLNHPVPICDGIIGGNPAVRGVFVRNKITCCRRRKALGWKDSFSCTPCSDLWGYLKPWTAWSHCSKSCGWGKQNRERLCSSRVCRGIKGDRVTAERKCLWKACCPVDGKWSQWGQWSACSTTCGRGVQNRKRTCSAPAASCGGKYCPNFPRQLKRCNPGRCAYWSKWKQDGPCSVSCGIGGVYKRRNCTNPLGDSCLGSSVIYDRCDAGSCNVDGNWCPWSNWSSCTRTCGEISGTRKRSRACECSSPKNGGLDCVGDDAQVEKCWSRDNSCPVNGNWNSWSDWSTCSAAKCSTTPGIQKRERLCNNPAPMSGGKNCEGMADENRKCLNFEACKFEGRMIQWSKWSSCSETCGQCGFKTRHRKCVSPFTQLKAKIVIGKYNLWCAENKTDDFETCILGSCDDGSNPCAPTTTETYTSSTSTLKPTTQSQSITIVNPNNKKIELNSLHRSNFVSSDTALSKKQINLESDLDKDEVFVDSNSMVDLRKEILSNQISYSNEDKLTESYSPSLSISEDYEGSSISGNELSSSENSIFPYVMKAGSKKRSRGNKKIRNKPGKLQNRNRSNKMKPNPSGAIPLSILESIDEDLSKNSKENEKIENFVREEEKKGANPSDLLSSIPDDPGMDKGFAKDTSLFAGEIPMHILSEAPSNPTEEIKQKAVEEFNGDSNYPIDSLNNPADDLVLSYLNFPENNNEDIENTKTPSLNMGIPLDILSNTDEEKLTSEEEDYVNGFLAGKHDWEEEGHIGEIPDDVLTGFGLMEDDFSDKDNVLENTEETEHGSVNGEIPLFALEKSFDDENTNNEIKAMDTLQENSGDEDSVHLPDHEILKELDRHFETEDTENEAASLILGSSLYDLEPANNNLKDGEGTVYKTDISNRTCENPTSLGFDNTQESKRCCNILENPQNSTTLEEIESCMVLHYDINEIEIEMLNRSPGLSRCAYRNKPRLLKNICCRWRDCKFWGDYRLRRQCGYCHQFCPFCSKRLFTG